VKDSRKQQVVSVSAFFKVRGREQEFIRVKAIIKVEIIFLYAKGSVFL